MKQKTKQTYRIPLRLNAAGSIDVHKEFFQVAVCRENEIPIETEFGTFTKDLYAVRDLFLQHDIRDVIMESTGVYWKPLYRVLSEAGLKVTVANPLRVKQIPMEKTDKKDARWLAKLLMNDMVKASFVPNEQQESLRSFTRMRTRYTQQLSRIKSQIIKSLELCNFKVRSIVSDISTKTGQKLAYAISEGKTDVDYLLLQCHHSVRRRQGDERVKAALTGRLNQSIQLQLQMLLEDWKYFEAQKVRTDNNIKELITTEQQQKIEKLDKVEGVNQEQGEIVMAEIGIGIDKFPTADKAAKEAGLTPGLRETSKKQKHIRAVPGNKYLRTCMVQIAWSAVKVRNGYWMAEYKHLKKRLGAKKAILAVARRLFKAIYKILHDDYDYQQWDANKYIDNRVKSMAYKQMAKAG